MNGSLRPLDALHNQGPRFTTPRSGKPDSGLQRGHRAEIAVRRWSSLKNAKGIEERSTTTNHLHNSRSRIKSLGTMRIILQHRRSKPNLPATSTIQPRMTDTISERKGWNCGGDPGRMAAYGHSVALNGHDLRSTTPR